MGKKTSTIAFLQSKLQVPSAGTDYLRRPRLSARLATFLERPCGLVVAPAGFGKSSLVAAWARSCPATVAWLSLDEADGDPARFWFYLMQAFVTAGVLSVDEASEALEANVGSGASLAVAESLIILLQQKGGASGPVVLVLDDFHKVGGDEALCDAVRHLVRNAPEGFHLVIVSRTEPALRLAKMRMDGLVAQVGQEDLGFTKGEVDSFLTRRRLAVDPAVADRVFEETRGWPAAVKLAALALGEGSGAGDALPARGAAAYVDGYLFEEVVDAMPPRVRRFVLATACLDSFCPSLARAVLSEALGDRGPAASVDPDVDAVVREGFAYLLAGDVFITQVVDPDGEPWYSYHALLRDAIVRRLKSTEPDLYGRVVRAACVWLERRGLLDDAVSYAARVADYDRIRDIIVHSWRPIYEVNDDLPSLMRWFSLLPDAYVARFPMLCLVEMLPLAVTGDFAKAQERFRQVEDSSKGLGDTFDALAWSFRGIAKSVEGDGATATSSSTRALELLPENERHFRSMMLQVSGSSMRDYDIMAARAMFRRAVQPHADSDSRSVLCSALSNLAYIDGLAGLCGEAYESVERARALFSGEVTKRTYPMLVVASMAELTCRFLQGDLAQAQALCDRVMQDVSLNYIARSVANAQTVRALVLAHKGAPEEERACVEAALATHPAGVYDVFPGLDRLRSWADIPGVAALARDCTLPSAGEAPCLAARWFALAFRLVAPAGAVMSSGAAAPATPVSPEELDALERDVDPGYLLAKVSVSIARCALLSSRGEDAEARAALVDALGYAEGEGIVQPFLDSASFIASVLRDLAREDATGFAGQVHRLLPAASEGQAPRQALAQGQAQGQPTLSDRELDVMRLIALGMSTDDAAAHLFISRDTVKKHLSNVYNKLGTHNRTQTVSVLRSLGLL